MTKYLDRDGGAECCGCGKYASVTEGLESCGNCDEFVCKSCKRFPKQMPSFGYLCPKCIKTVQ